MAADGIPYSAKEVRVVIAQHVMDPYHRALLQWLLDERVRHRKIAKEALELAAEANGDPSSCSYNVPLGERVVELREEIKSHG